MADEPKTISELRSDVAAAQAGFAKAYWEWSQAPDDTTKQAALEEARGTEQAAVAALNSAIQTKITSGDLTLEKLKTNAPIILLPVRLETRIVENDMFVRIYPDEIWVDMLQRALTPEEYESGALFWQKKLLKGYWNPGDPWTDRKPGDPNLTPAHLSEKDERELWDAVVKKHGNRRGAWIVRSMLPHLPGKDFSSLFSTELWPNLVHDGTVFSDAQRAPDQWSSPALAVLPDRWWVWGYRGNTIQKVWSDAVREPLQITTDPRAKEDAFNPVVPGDDSHKIEDGLRWTINFENADSEDLETACKVGMGVKLSLAGQSNPRGFDKIIVVGVKASMDGATTTAHLDGLLDSHHYSRGMAFVPQGTPTNNTEAVATPYTRLDDEYDSFAVEWEELALSQGNFLGSSPADYASLSVTEHSNGFLLSRALGVKTVTFSSIREALDTEQRRAMLMNRLLFPATLGYMMDQIMEATFSADQWFQASEFFEQYLRGRGPLPAFRIGAVPYGVLPVVHLAHWKSSDNEPYSQIESVLCKYLVGKWSSFLSATQKKAPRLNRAQASTTTVTPEQELLRVLGMHASARSFYIRRCLGEYTVGPVEVAIPHVVNGQSMLAYYLAHNRNLYPNVPNPSAAQKAVNAAAEAVALQMDAVADLVVSESVYQITKGNMTAVTASGEALARGFRPADPQIARGQEGGVDVSQRVALVFAMDPPGPDAPPRKAAEPQADRWVESRLGDLFWTVEYTKDDGSSAAVELHLSDLGLCALDLIALFEADQSGKLSGSVLESRLIDAAHLSATDTLGAIVEKVRPVARLGALARALGRVLTSARPLRFSDLMERARISEAEETDLLTGQGTLAVRAKAALDGLAAVSGSLSRDTLVALAKYIPNAYPSPSATDDDLATLLADMQTEQQRRIAAANAEAAGADSTEWTVDQSVEILKAVFGREFVALPTFSVPFSDDLQASLDHDWVTDEDEVRKTLDKMAVSRDPMRAWRILNATIHATSTQPDGTLVPVAPMHFKVAQLPMMDNEPWVGRTMSDAVSSGRLSLIVGVVDDDIQFGNGTLHSGIVIDDWTERVPAKTVDMGVAFHSESPAAEAPQAVLIAVPPKINQSSTETWSWSMEDLFAVVSQTLDLAKIRALDLSSLDEGQYLPATLMAYSKEIKTASTDYSGLRAAIRNLKT
jgi:hypothetical protein